MKLFQELTDLQKGKDMENAINTAPIPQDPLAAQMAAAIALSKTKTEGPVVLEGTEQPLTVEDVYIQTEAELTGTPKD